MEKISFLFFLGRCTIFSDLSIVTYDGNHLALFKEASYIVSQTQDETITIHVLDCRVVSNVYQLTNAQFFTETAGQGEVGLCYVVTYVK